MATQIRHPPAAIPHTPLPNVSVMETWKSANYSYAVTLDWGGGGRGAVAAGPARSLAISGGSPCHIWVHGWRICLPSLSCSIPRFRRPAQGRPPAQVLGNGPTLRLGFWTK